MKSSTLSLANKTDELHSNEITKFEEQAAKEGATYLQRANELVIDNDTQESVATNILSMIAVSKKTLEEQRKFLVKPLNDHVKAINNRFKLYSEPLNQADAIIRKKVLDYKKLKEQRRLEEERKVREAAEEEQARLAMSGIKTPLPEPVVPKAPATTRAELGSTNIKKVWTFEIVDESQIPREYLTVNTKKIAAVVKAGIRNIPGVRIYQQDQLSVRARAF